MELTLRPSWKQHLAYISLLSNKVVKFLLFGGGANGGKSWLGCEWIILMCMRYAGVRYFIARKELTKLKRTTLKTFFKVARHHALKRDVHYIYNAQTNTITFANGSEVLLLELNAKPGDPLFEDLGSLEVTGGFIDEAGQIAFLAFDVLKSRVGRCLNTLYGIPAKILLSCNPTKNWLYTVFYKPKKDGTLPKEYEFIQSLVGDNPNRDAGAEDQLVSITDVATKERLLRGNWEYDDDPACLFDFDVIADLFTNTADASDETYIIGDVSRKGRDNFPISYWEGLDLKECILLPYDIRRDTTRSAAFIERWAAQKQVRRSNVLLDEDGVGGGCVDILKCKGFINNSRPLPEPGRKEDTNFANLKTQCYFKFADLAKAAKIRISGLGEKEKGMLAEELGQIKQKNIDRDGKIAIVEKAVMKDALGRSPDIADMCMMRMYYELKHFNLKSFFV